MNIVDYRVEWLPSVTNSVDVFLQQSSQQCGVMTILSEGAAGDFAAYRGIILDMSTYPQATDAMIRSKEFVARYGNKISEQEARAMFSQLEGKDYRK